MESTTTNNQIKKVIELFNEIRSNLSHEKINKIRNKLYKKEVVYIYIYIFKKDDLTDNEKNVLKNIGNYIKKLNDFKNLQKYQDNITYGLDYLFNEEDYYTSRALLVVTMYYMKVEEIKMVNYHYMNILIILNLI